LCEQQLVELTWMVKRVSKRLLMNTARTTWW
jgi:hypothetical protein